MDWLAQLVTHIPNKGESAGGGSDITNFTQISHGACARKQAWMTRLQPSMQRWRPRNFGKTGRV